MRARLSLAILLVAGMGLVGCDWHEETGFVEVKKSFTALAAGDILILNLAPVGSRCPEQSCGAAAHRYCQHSAQAWQDKSKALRICGSEESRGDRDADGTERVASVFGPIVGC